ncbi:hypothetical protein EB835_06445 [Brevibacterium sp. S22]|nr:hypothetical protein EB835_06445 [Brevibacterium sp. S22]
MTNHSIGYVYEIVAMMMTADLLGMNKSGLRNGALKNGVTEDQLRNARIVLSALPDTSNQGLVEFTHRIYIMDGLERGYISSGEENKYTPQEISQLAYEHYRQ